MKEEYQKILKKLTWFFLLHSAPFYWHDYEKQKEPETSYQSLFGLQDILRKIPFSVMDHLGSSDDLIQSGFWVIPKIIFAYLCNKPIHDFIIITVSSDHLNLKNMERKGKKYTNLNISRTKRAF